MTVASGKMLPVGLRKVTIFDINADGRPLATSETAFEGIQLEGAKAFTLTPPEPRRIDHAGDDRLLQSDVLPPLTGIVAQMAASKTNFDVHEILTNTNKITLNEAVEIAHGTDKEGDYPQVALHFYQQALDASGVNRSRRWRSVFVPSAIVYPLVNSAAETEQDLLFAVVGQKVVQRLWGETLIEGTDGYTDAQMFEYMTEFEPKVVSWESVDAVASKLLFPANFQAQAATKIHIVTVDGVEDTAATLEVDGITPSGTPAIAIGSMVTCFYEFA